MTQDDRGDAQRHNDRRIVLDAAKDAADVSASLAEGIFETIARVKQPTMTDAQVADAYQIYRTMTDPQRSMP